MLVFAGYFHIAAKLKLRPHANERKYLNYAELNLINHKAGGQIII